MGLVGSLVVSLTANTQPFQQGMGQSAQSVKQLQQATVSAQGSISGLQSAMMGLAAQYIGINAVKDALVSLVQAGMRMESLKITMNNVFGGQAAAEGALRKTREVSDQLGLSAEETARGFTNLTAAARGTAVEGATTEKMFMQLVAITRALGKSTQDTSGVLLASQQILTKGTIMAEEFRGQLGERLPGILQAGAKTMGTSLEGFSKMMERGELGAKHFAAIIQTMFDDVGKNAIASADTFESAFNRLGNAWTKFGDQIVSGPVGAFMKETVDAITRAIEGWSIIFEKVGRLQGGRPVPSMERRQFITEGFVDEKSPEFQKLELIATKASIVARMIYDLDQNMQALGPDETSINKMAKLEQKLIELNAQYQTQRERVVALNEIGKQYRERLDEANKAADEQRQKMERLTNALSQTTSKIKELSEIQGDFARRTAEQPQQKEFFARDFLSDTKKIFDFLTLQLSRIKKQVEEQPAITFKQGAEFERLKAAVDALTKGREDATGFLKDLEELERGMKRVLAIEDEIAKMTLGPEGAQLTADARRRANQEQIIEVMKLAGVSMEAARAEVARQQVVADNARFEADATRVRGEIADKVTDQFKDLRVELEKQGTQILETKQSWLEYAIAMRQLKPEDEEFLRNQAAKNQSMRDFATVLNETMQRILEIENETAAATVGPDAAKDTEAERRLQHDRQLDRLKELGKVSVEAAHNQLQSLLALARANNDVAQAERVRQDIARFQAKPFTDILEALAQQRRALLETRKSWLELKIAQAQLKPEQEQKLRDDATKVSDLQDFTVQLSETMQRVLQLRIETAKLTFGPDAAEDMAIGIRQDVEKTIDKLKELAQVNEAAARQQVDLQLAMAREANFAAEGGRVSEEMKERRLKDFKDINFALDEERKGINRSAESAMELRIRIANLSEVDREWLQTKRQNIEIDREWITVRQEQAQRDQDYQQIIAGLRDETDKLKFSERELLEQRLANAEPLVRQDALERFDEKSAGDFKQRAAERALAQNESVTSIIVGLQDQQRQLTMTSTELLDFELATNNASKGQRAFAQSLLEANKIAGVASSLSNFAIDFATTDALEMLKGTPESATLASNRLKLDQLKSDIATAEQRLALAQQATPERSEQIRVQIEQLQNMKAKYVELQEAIRVENAKTESAFEKFMTKLSQFLLKLAFDSAEVNKALTKLISQGISLGLSLLGGVGSVTEAAGSTGRAVNVVATESVASTTILAKQHGGPFFTGQPMLVGEAGPELILPTVPGVVLTNSQTQGALGARMPTVIVNISTPDAQSFQQSRGQVSRALLNAIAQAQRSL